MSIHWFPGHMNKARRVLKERIAKSDLIIEVLDARLPRASQNPMLRRLRGEVPCLRILTKPDLADPRTTQAWIRDLTEDSIRVMELVAVDLRRTQQVVKAARALAPSRGRPGFPVRVLIAGIPNVGKSTLFNALAGKKKAEVKDQPAVTRREQQIEIPGGLLLVDSPGVLWPKLDDQRGAHCLAASGAIRETAYDPVEVARFTIALLSERYPSELASRYRLARIAPDPDEVLSELGRRRGCLSRGGVVDMNQAAVLLLTDLRAGSLGRISLEHPGTEGHDRQPTSAEAAPLDQEEDDDV